MASAAVRRAEHALECAVTETIGKMRLVWIGVDDAAGPDSERARIERNAIALLSSFGKPPLDPAASRWLGRHCAAPRVRESGLWNVDHVDEQYDRRFLDRLR
jgi:hypothetical protein